MSVIESALWSAPQIRIPEHDSGGRLPGIAQHHIVAKIVLSCLRQLLIDSHRLRIRSRIMNSGESPAIAFADRRKNCVSRLLASGGGDRAIDQSYGVVDEEARPR